MARICAASSYQLSPHWHKASGSETQEKMLHSVAMRGSGQVMPNFALIDLSEHVRKIAMN
jgi:hypothetical protein